MAGIKVKVFLLEASQIVERVSVLTRWSGETDLHKIGDLFKNLFPMYRYSHETVFCMSIYRIEMHLSGGRDFC